MGKVLRALKREIYRRGLYTNGRYMTAKAGQIATPMTPGAGWA
jgi:hypothetical protein